MRRRLFTFASVMSLLLCVTAVVLWVRSYWFADGITGEKAYDTYEVVSVRGRVAVRLTEFYADAPDIDRDVSPMEWKVGHGGPPDLWRPGRFWYRVPPVRQWEFGGFEYLSGHYGSGIDHAFTQFECPDWVLVGVLLIVPLIWLRRHRQRIGRTVAGQCFACRYNLTGNTSGICPECGTPIPQGSEAGA